jgi:hypothetical protein
MMRLCLMALVCCCAAVEASPIPKALKRPKTSGEPNGVWELTKFMPNGREGNHKGMSKLWEIDGEVFYIGIATPDDRGQTGGNELKIMDADDPDFRMYSRSYPSRLKCSGDELSWVYTSDKSIKLDECEPGPGRYYYEFKRVK